MIVRLLLSFLIAVPAGAVGVYKWTDAQGRVHYGDSAPSTGHPAAVRLPAEVPRQEDAGAVEPAARVVDVTLYTASWCRACRQVRAFLDAKGIPYREWDVEKTDYGESRYRALGGGELPLITVDGEVLRAFDERRFLYLWHRAGGDV